MKTGATEAQLDEANQRRISKLRELGWIVEDEGVRKELIYAAEDLVPPTHRIIRLDWLERPKEIADWYLTDADEEFADDIDALIAGEETDAKAE